MAFLSGLLVVEKVSHSAARACLLPSCARRAASSCQREPERCREQAGPDAEGTAARAGAATGAGLGDQERPVPAGTAQSPAAGLTSATEIGTGEGHYQH
jgi:hypothetical protein